MMKRLFLLSALLCASQNIHAAADGGASAKKPSDIIKIFQPACAEISFQFTEQNIQPKGPYVGITACLVLHPDQLVAQAVANSAMKPGFKQAEWEEKGRSDVAKSMTSEDLAKGSICWPKIIALIEVARSTVKTFPDAEVFVRTDKKREGFPNPFMRLCPYSVFTQASHLRLPKCLISFGEDCVIEEFSAKDEIVELLRRGPAGEAALQKAWRDYLREKNRFGIEIDLAEVEKMWQSAATSAKR